MKSSKERKMERKRRSKELSVTKTEKSRQRRLDNKARRTEIIAINPYAKIDIIDQVTYVDGVKVEILNGMIVPLKSETVEIFEPNPEEYKKGRAIDDQIEKERLGGFNPFRWRKK